MTPRLYVIREWIILAIVAGILVLLVLAVDRRQHEAARADAAERRADDAELRMRATEYHLGVCRDDNQRVWIELGKISAAMREGL